MPKESFTFKGARTGKDRYTSTAVGNDPGYDYTVDYEQPYKGVIKRKNPPKKASASGDELTMPKWLERERAKKNGRSG